MRVRFRRVEQVRRDEPGDSLGVRDFAELVHEQPAAVDPSAELLGGEPLGMSE
jgi:hypothetical protein